MIRTLALTAAVAVVLLQPGRASADPKHPRLHAAIYEMREAKKQLKEAAHNFGGHRVRAMEAIDAAVRQVELALDTAGDPYQGYAPPVGNYDSYPDHPHIRRSIVDMEEARKVLKNAPRVFGGHREKAIEALNVAINQTELCVKAMR